MGESDPKKEAAVYQALLSEISTLERELLALEDQAEKQEHFLGLYPDVNHYIAGIPDWESNLYEGEGDHTYFEKLSRYESLVPGKDLKRTFELGLCYFLGAGVDVNYAKALPYFEKVKDRSEGNLKRAAFLFYELDLAYTGEKEVAQKALYAFLKENGTPEAFRYFYLTAGPFLEAASRAVLQEKVRLFIEGVPCLRSARDRSKEVIPFLRDLDSGSFRREGLDQKSMGEALEAALRYYQDDFAGFFGEFIELLKDPQAIDGVLPLLESSHFELTTKSYFEALLALRTSKADDLEKKAKMTSDPFAQILFNEALALLQNDEEKFLWIYEEAIRILYERREEVETLGDDFPHLDAIAFERPLGEETTKKLIILSAPFWANYSLPELTSEAFAKLTSWGISDTLALEKKIKETLQIEKGHPDCGYLRDSPLNFLSDLLLIVMRNKPEAFSADLIEDFLKGYCGEKAPKNPFLDELDDLLNEAPGDPVWLLLRGILLLREPSEDHRKAATGIFEEVALRSGQSFQLFLGQWLLSQGEDKEKAYALLEGANDPESQEKVGELYLDPQGQHYDLEAGVKILEGLLTSKNSEAASSANSALAHYYFAGPEAYGLKAKKDYPRALALALASAKKNARTSSLFLLAKLCDKGILSFRDYLAVFADVGDRLSFDFTDDWSRVLLAQDENDDTPWTYAPGLEMALIHSLSHEKDAPRLLRERFRSHYFIAHGLSATYVKEAYDRLEGQARTSLEAILSEVGFLLSQDLPHAAALYLSLAEDGDDYAAVAAYSLAPEKAQAVFQRALNDFDPYALELQGDEESKEESDEAQERAHFSYQKAYELGNLSAAVKLGEIAEKDKDYQKACDLFCDARKSVPAAYRGLARLCLDYHLGSTVAESEAEGQRYAYKALKKGELGVLVDLDHYVQRNGCFSVGRDYGTRGKQSLRDITQNSPFGDLFDELPYYLEELKALDQQTSLSTYAFYLGAYLYFPLTEKSHEEGLHYWKEAAQAHHPYAEALLGRYYCLGIGTPYHPLKGWALIKDYLSQSAEARALRRRRKKAAKALAAGKHLAGGDNGARRLIFVSWNHKDKLLKNRLLRALAKEGLAKEIFWESDASCSGEIVRTCENAIAKTRVALLLITKHALKSPYVRLEVETILKKDKAYPELIKPVFIGVTSALAKLEKVEPDNPFVILKKESGALFSFKGKADQKALGTSLKEEIGASYLYQYEKRLKEKLYFFAPLFTTSHQEANAIRASFSWAIATALPRRLTSLEEKKDYSAEESLAWLGEDKLALLYAPGGSGKTIFLRQALRKHLEGEHRGDYCFFFSCQELAKSLLKWDFVSALSLEIQAEGTTPDPYVKERVSALFHERFVDGKGNEEKKVILVLDALDEIPAGEERTAFDRALAAFISRYQNVSYVFTSRDGDEARFLAGLFKEPCPRYQLIPLTKKEAGEIFDLCASNAHFAQEEVTPVKLGAWRENFLSFSSLGDPFLNNPLFLMNLAWIYLYDQSQKKESEFPKNEFGIAYESIAILFTGLEKEKSAAEPYWTFLAAENGKAFQDLLGYLALASLESKESSEVLLSRYLTQCYSERFSDAPKAAEAILAYLRRRGVFLEDGFSQSLYRSYFIAQYCYLRSVKEGGDLLHPQLELDAASLEKFQKEYFARKDASLNKASVYFALKLDYVLHLLGYNEEKLADPSIGAVVADTLAILFPSPEEEGAKELAERLKENELYLNSSFAKHLKKGVKP